MASIRKRNAKWHVQIRRLGHKSITKSFSTREAAEKWARKTEAHLDNSYWADGNFALLNVRFEVLLTRYLQEITPHKKHQENEAYFIRRLLKEPLAAISLCLLSAEKIQQFVDETAANKKPATVRREFAIIRHCLNTARELWGFPIKTEVTANVRLPRLPPLQHHRLPGQIFSALEEPKELIEWIVIFALETAMRRGEILNLKWSDIDRSNQLATLRETKNGHSRYVPLTKKAMAALDHGDRNSEHVFPMTVYSLRYGWARFRRRHGADSARFHDLRHEAISRLFEKGLTVPEVAAISGHRTASMLFRYAHADLNRLREMLS